MHNIVAVFDVDGVFTDGTFWQHAKKGKMLKRFGADDWDALDELRKYVTVMLITADKKGFPIVESRVVNDKLLPLELVSNKPQARWGWIEENYPDMTKIYIGDGIYDWYPLQKADFGITTCSALETTKFHADFVSDRKSGDRFVADACLCIMHQYNLCDIKRLGWIDD